MFGCINFSERHKEQSSSMPQVLVWVSSTVKCPLCCTVDRFLPQFLQDVPSCTSPDNTLNKIHVLLPALSCRHTTHTQGDWPWPLACLPCLQAGAEVLGAANVVSQSQGTPSRGTHQVRCRTQFPTQRFSGCAERIWPPASH